MIDSLKIEFSEKDPSGFRGKYAHKIYGYLLPSTTGMEETHPFFFKAQNHSPPFNPSFLLSYLSPSLSSFLLLPPFHLPLYSFPLAPLLLLPPPPSTPGDYFFSIEMTKMTAACTVEFWISTDHDPTATRRLLILEYPEMVRTRMFVSLAAEIMTQGYPRGGGKNRVQL